MLHEPSTRDPTALVLLKTWLNVGAKIAPLLGLVNIMTSEVLNNLKFKSCHHQFFWSCQTLQVLCIAFLQPKLFEILKIHISKLENFEILNNLK
jgi:hypothetical protein